MIICILNILTVGTFLEVFYNNHYSLWPSDATWRQRSGSILAQVMACCLTAPMLTYYQWSPVTSILGQIHKRCLNHQSLKSVWKLHVSNFIKIPRGQWFNQRKSKASIFHSSFGIVLADDLASLGAGTKIRSRRVQGVTYIFGKKTFVFISVLLRFILLSPLENNSSLLCVMACHQWVMSCARTVKYASLTYWCLCLFPFLFQCYIFCWIKSAQYPF